MQKKLYGLGISILIVLSGTVLAYDPCEINFVRYVNGELPADISKNPAVNLWSNQYDSAPLVKKLSQMKNSQARYEYLEELIKLVKKDETYVENITDVINRIHQRGLFSLEDINNLLVKRKFDDARFFYSKLKEEVRGQVEFDPLKVSLVNAIIKKTKLPTFYRNEYRNTLLQSNRTYKELLIASNSGMKLRPNERDLVQFKNYLDYLDTAKVAKLKKGLKNIENIYRYDVKAPIIPVDLLYKPHNQFLAQVDRLEKFTKKRSAELERMFKLQMKNGVVTEVDAIADRQANGIRVRAAEKLRLQKRLDDIELPQSLKTRARHQAVSESNIYRKMLNGCNSGSSPRIANAKKKFSRFKFSLALGATPFFYITKNKDKMDKDRYFWEKLGHEMMMSLVFTFVGNKLFTNTNSTFWGKYFTGMWQFGILSYAEAYTYEELFGEKSAIRYFQKLYHPNVPPSKLEQQLQDLKKSPTFKKDVEELFAYLEEQSKKKNTKNFFDKYLDISTYSSLEKDFKITQEDLESEEAREMMMELIAERIYLQNMGQWPIFQTGAKDTDRWAFYRSRNVLWDMKGLMLNLTLFELMCREPFGKVGSWGAILAIVMGDQYITGDITYGYRREAINQ